MKILIEKDHYYFINPTSVQFVFVSLSCRTSIVNIGYNRMQQIYSGMTFTNQLINNYNNK